jgi:hypothetical protein
MDKSTVLKNYNVPLTDSQRGMFGFLLGLAIMLVLVQFTHINGHDFDAIQRGVRTMVMFDNPWVPIEDWYEFFNPPHSVLFLWPMLLVTPQALQAIGGALLFAIVFYKKVWVALAWFFTNSVLWVVGTGNIDMYVMGVGVLLLFAGDKYFGTRRGLFLRLLAYGMLTVKPQGGLFIAGLYFLLRRDWKAGLLSVLIYVVCFLPLYPSWLTANLEYPIITAGVVSHSVWAAFGPAVAVVIAVLVLMARRWTYWQLGGALAGILAPYGMPGVPFFFMLTAVPALKAIPAVILFSGGLVALTWFQSPPAGVTDVHMYYKSYLDIYNLVIIGFGLSLAALSRPTDQHNRDDIALNEFVGRHVHTVVARLRQLRGIDG